MTYIDENNCKQYTEDDVNGLQTALVRAEAERDELAAQVEVMRDAILEYRAFFASIPAGKDALSITPSAALREIQARTLEEFADYAECSPVEWSFGARDMALGMAAAKRKGE